MAKMTTAEMIEAIKELSEEESGRVNLKMEDIKNG